MVGGLPREASTHQFWANAQDHQLARRRQWLSNGYFAYYEPKGKAVRFVRRDNGGAKLRNEVATTRQFTSSILKINSVYTRSDLRELFDITDATLNNGVFRPKGTQSVWLFVTEDKTADRTQYRDRLEGDTLYWQGQSLGRTDQLVINHISQDLELLVFFRSRKYEFAGAGFKYLGPFVYVSHQGTQPTSFVLRKRPYESQMISPEQGDLEAFDPDSIQDARERIAQTIARRRGQQAFRNALLLAYEGKCAMSGCEVQDVLEAAHITPYLGIATNAVSNGLLLRSDLHTLFDCGLIAVDPKTKRIVTSTDLAGSCYAHLNGVQLRLPGDVTKGPSARALKQHLEQSAIFEHLGSQSAVGTPPC